MRDALKLCGSYVAYCHINTFRIENYLVMGRGHFTCQAITYIILLQIWHSSSGCEAVRLAQYSASSHCVTNSAEMKGMKLAQYVQCIFCDRRVEMRCMLQCLCEHSTADLTATNKGWQGYP